MDKLYLVSCLIPSPPKFANVVQCSNLLHFADTEMLVRLPANIIPSLNEISLLTHGMYEPVTRLCVWYRHNVSPRIHATLHRQTLAFVLRAHVWVSVRMFLVLGMSDRQSLNEHSSFCYCVWKCAPSECVKIIWAWISRRLSYLFTIIAIMVHSSAKLGANYVRKFLLI